MIAVQIPDVKQFMVKLFSQTVFHRYEVTELKIRTFCDFTIDCVRNLEFYPAEEQKIKSEYFYLLWEELKPYMFQLIKGNRTPIVLRIVFLLPENQMEQLFEANHIQLSQNDCKLLLNVRFENGKLLVVSGCSYKTFTIDKSAERIWEDYIKSFLKQSGIGYEEV